MWSFCSVTLLLREDLLLPLEARNSVDDWVEEGHLNNAQTKNIYIFHVQMAEPFKYNTPKLSISAQACV